MRSSARVSPRSVMRVAAISATTSFSDFAVEATAPVQLMSPTVRKRTDDEAVYTGWVRYRTVGDMSCTGAVASRATTLDEVVAEIAATRITERGETRADDRASEAAMEDRKVAGYF